MSVNAVNQANVANVQHTQQQRSGIPPLASGLGLGVLGAGAGYMWGGKSTSLEEVFAQEPDTFNATIKKLSEKDTEAAQKIEAERNAIYTTPDVVAKKEAYEQKNQELKEKISREITDYDNKAALEEAVTKAEEELKNLAPDATDIAKEDAQMKLSDAKRAVADAKMKKFIEDLTSDPLLKDVIAKESEYTTALNNAIENSAKKDNIKEAFSKVKKVLVEGKGKAAALYGATALVAGMILASVFRSSPKENQ